MVTGPPNHGWQVFSVSSTWLISPFQISYQSSYLVNLAINLRVLVFDC